MKRLKDKYKYICIFLLGFIIGITYVIAIQYLVIHFKSRSYTVKLNKYLDNYTCTFENYEKILAELKRDRYVALRVVDFIRLARASSLHMNKVIIILSHDVDYYVEKKPV